MSTQFFTDDLGNKVAVVIPIKGHDELMEDAVDFAAVAERRDEEQISLAELKSQLIADGLLPH
ncbi:hypothetical protein JIN85_01860 [Luteolibacter pohnpeiensis]|uniref:Uncharacterized protein n=1 Tax=Luteolibacter pohnpeiensis TaxID=454153 RepID=A0A934VUV0_9BACT|nr:hypothetical protein [Luteolibacter pohnpeiensis]MBK1881138.1 hypothetical protein [Luteolibacter pohnpeiensis]